MERLAVIDKRRGETPLEALERFRDANPPYRGIPASYAGRLDPMASGLLLVLLGDECKRQGRYTKLDKEYEIEVVLDLATDTGDALGMPSYTGTDTNPAEAPVQAALRAACGTHPVPYPAFSSKTVRGTPLFQYALAGTLDSIEMPVHDETIYRIRVLNEERVSRDALRSRIRGALAQVPRSNEPSKALGADFRQDAIRTAWEGLFASMPERSFAARKLRVTCGSGTYMRTLAGRIARELGTTGFALSIRRTRIGTYAHVGPFGWWLREYKKKRAGV